jgi:glycosyltransferase involved in cell wall biosynthesis
MRSPYLSVVIPTFNEEAHIAQTIGEVVATIDRLGLGADVVVVDDGSSDRTAAIVEGAARSEPRVRLVRAAHAGKGAAVTPDAFQGTYRGGRSDAFVTELNLDGSAPVYSTYLGGGQRDSGRAVIVRGGDAYVTGFTTSFNFPTTPGAYDPTFNGNRDVFVTRFDLRRQRR